MSNKFKIFYESTLNIPQIELRFDGGEPVILKNNTATDIELEPGPHEVSSSHSLFVGSSQMDFAKKFNVTIEEGLDYDAKVCIILKSLSLVKRGVF